MAFNLDALGSVLQGAGSIYGAWNQKKMGDEMLSMQKDFVNEEKKRKKKSQARLDYATASAYGHRDDDARLPVQY